MFVGKIKLSDNTMMFRLDDYELIISNSEGQWTSWNDIKAIINDGWIKLEDFSENVIYAYIEDVEFLNLYEYKCNLQFYVIDWHRKGEKHTLEFDKIDGKLICRKKNNRHRINIDGNNKMKIEFCFRKLNLHSIEMDCYAGLQRRCGYN